MAFWEIVHKASSVDKAARADGTFRSRHQRVSVLHGLQPSPAACTETIDLTFSPTTTALSHSRPRETSQVHRFAWAALYWNVAVVLWGAYVRATGSGAGCGNRWPLCGGDVIGANAKGQTIVEFTHRATSGVDVFLVAALLIWAFRAFPRGNPVRLGATLSAVFLLS